MNIFKKIAIKLKLIKPKKKWFKKFFKSFRSLFSLKSKKTKFFVSAFVVLALASGFFVVYSQGSRQDDGPSINRGLVGHWTMDEEDYNFTTNRVTDKTPYANHGTNYGATFTEDRHGKEGGAMSFNGSSHSEVSSFQLTPSNNSVSLWIKVDSIPSDYRIIFVHGSSGMGLGFYNGNRLILTSGGNRQRISDLSNFKTGQWNHIAILYDSSNIPSVFINGIEPSYSSSNNWTQAGNNLYIGKRSSGNNFNGLIDDFRIYDRALSESEIKSLYDTYNPKTTTGSLQKGLILDMPLKLKYTKSEASGSEIMTDRTPYGNDGQNYGATVTDEGAMFNGSSNRISMGSFAVGDSFSMGSWAKVNNPNNSTSGLGGIISNHVHTGSTYGATLYVRNLNSIVIAGGDGDGDRGSKSFYPNINFGEWNHFFTTYENGEFKVYVNGDLIGNFVKNVAQNDTSWRIGQWASSYSSYYYHGSLSGAKVYNRALSEDEVKTLYDRGRSD